MSDSANVIPIFGSVEGEDGSAGGGVALSEAKRMAEAIVFASAEPVSRRMLEERLPEGVDIAKVMEALAPGLCHAGRESRARGRQLGVSHGW